jgi:glycosyltransferase involved in cell wall biosynthesis
MKAPYFTVLIDTFNYGRYVEEAVSSALEQDFPAGDREILVVDDGSTDDTQERLKKFGNAIRYLRKTNGGQASAFNVGFDQARGQVIALLDADDVWLPEKLSRVHQVFEKKPEVAMVYHRVHMWDGIRDLSEDPCFIPISGRVTEDRRALLQYPMMATSCLAFRREALRKVLPVPETLRFQADAYLTGLIIFAAPVAALPEYLGKYRLHGANLFQANGEKPTRSQIEQKMEMRGVLLHEIRNWLSRNGRDVESADLRAYLMQWKKSQESDGFAIRPPGRWRYFRHLLEFPLTYGEIMTRRHRTYSYMRAFSALLLGHSHLHVLDDLRVKRKQLVASLTTERVVAKKEKALAAKV